jgi:nucleotide-binding universal stress UspA family protein
LLGRSTLDDTAAAALETVLADVHADVAFLHAPEGWGVETARRVLIPVGGRGLHSVMRARILGSLCREAPRDITWLQTLPVGASDAELAAARQRLSEMAADSLEDPSHVEVVRADDVPDAVAARAEQADLVILGLSRGERGRRVFGSVAPEIARRTRCATLLISRRG